MSAREELLARGVDRIKAQGAAEERARIRERLLEVWPVGTAVPWTDRDQDWLVVVEAICPKE